MKIALMTEGKTDDKDRAGTGFTPGNDLAAMTVNDLLTGSQPHARSIIDIAGMQPYEGFEYPFQIFIGQTYAIILD